MKWQMIDYRQMKDIEDEGIERWAIKGILMSFDKYAPYYYFPPVPMDADTFYYLRRN